MMASRRRTRVLAAMGWFMAPIVIIQGSVFLLDRPGPGVAAAGGGDDVALAGPVQATASVGWTEAARAAEQRAADLRLQPFAEPPLYFPPAPEVVPEPDPAPEPEPDLDPEPPIQVTLDVSVQMIMTSETEEIALIDGRPYRAGETLKSGDWIVQEIISEDRAVIFRHASTGQVEVRHVPIT